MSAQDNTPTEQFESHYDAKLADNTEYLATWELRDGDVFVPRVSWYDYEDKPTTFRVTREISEMARETLEDGKSAMASVDAVGSDGKTYRFYIDNPHVEQDGRDAGTRSGRPLKIDE